LKSFQFLMVLVNKKGVDSDRHKIIEIISKMVHKVNAIY